MNNGLGQINGKTASLFKGLIWLAPLMLPVVAVAGGWLFLQSIEHSKTLSAQNTAITHFQSQALKNEQTQEEFASDLHDLDKMVQHLEDTKADKQ